MSRTDVAAARVVARFLLLIGALAPLAVLVLFALGPQAMGGCFGCDTPAVAGIPTDVFIPIMGIAGVLFGLAWMWRIYRAPTRFLEARWRYRDR